MTELGQALFGTCWNQYGAEHVSNGLRVIADAVDPNNFGYATYYNNDVFSIRPYYWGDCTCGFEASECVWEEEHQHADSCWTNKYRNNLSSITSSEAELLTVARTLGWKFDVIDGIAVYCDCGVDKLYEEWRKEHDHSTTCLLTVPNFAYKPTQLQISWYKYIGRGVTANQELSRQEWSDIVTDCIKSIKVGVSKMENAQNSTEKFKS